MIKIVPEETVTVFANSIIAEARKYGFSEVDIVRLINNLLDHSLDGDLAADDSAPTQLFHELQVEAFPLSSSRLQIRAANLADDLELLNGWISDQYGRHFLLSCATAQPIDIRTMLQNPANSVGIVMLQTGQPVGAVAYLDVDTHQKRAELRKMIGESSARGQGYAEEATMLWIRYGGEILGLEKIYVSTLQTHLRNIQLNESIGFRVEGLMRREILIDGERMDVLRMGLCYDEFCRQFEN